MTQLFFFGVILYCIGIANGKFQPITDPWLFGFIAGSGLAIVAREDRY